MPGFKSIAQRNRCLGLVREGKMMQEQFDTSDKETNLAELPERLHPKAGAKTVPMTE